MQVTAEARRLSQQYPSLNARLWRLLSEQRGFSVGPLVFLLPSGPLTYVYTELSPDELASIQILRDDTPEEDADWEMADGAFADVLDGHQALDISHEGGEFEALADLERRMRRE